MGGEEARRGALALALVLAALTSLATAAPLSDSTEIESYDEEAGCYYNFQHYGEGDRIMTNEPCLNCTCHNRMLMCYLRVCPFTKPIGQDCVVEKRGDQCCPIITCPDVPVDLVDSTTMSTVDSTEVGHHDNYGCSIDGRFYSDGAQVPSKQNKPCELCYCIRNMTACVMQECTLHVEGCTPVYQRGVCCPVRYSCDHPEDEGPLMIDDMTTTVRPTPGFILTTTLTPGYTMECTHHDEVYADGAMIATDKACEHCYCMKGDIVCAVQECGTPMENEGKNCTALPPRAGQCCPDTYVCDGEENSSTIVSESVNEATTESKIEQELEVSKHEKEHTTKSDEQHKPEGESDVTHTTITPDDVSRTTVSHIEESTEIRDHEGEDTDKSEENVTDHKLPSEKLPQHRDELSGEHRPDEHDAHHSTEGITGGISSTEKQPETYDDSNKDSSDQQTVVPIQDEIHQTTEKTNETPYEVITEIASTENNKHIAMDSVTESYEAGDSKIHDKDESSEHSTKSEITPKQEEVTTHHTIKSEKTPAEGGDDFEQDKQQEEIYPQQEILEQEQEKITPPTQLFTSKHEDHTKPNIELSEKDVTGSPLPTIQGETEDSDLHVTKSPEILDQTHDVKETHIPGHPSEPTDYEKGEYDGVFGVTESSTTLPEFSGSTPSESDQLKTKYTEGDEINVDKTSEITTKQSLPVTVSGYDVTTESEKQHTSISHDYVTEEPESEESSGDGNAIDDSGAATTIGSIDSTVHSTHKDTESHTEKSVKSDTELEKETPAEFYPEITTVHSEIVTSIPSIGDSSSDIAPEKDSTEQDEQEEISTDKQIVDTVTVATHQQEEHTVHTEDSYATTFAPIEIETSEHLPKATTLRDLVDEVTTIVNEVKKSDDKKDQEIQHTTEIYTSEDENIVTDVEHKTDIPEVSVTEFTKQPSIHIHDHTVPEKEKTEDVIDSTTNVLTKLDYKPQEEYTTTHPLIEEEKVTVKGVEVIDEEKPHITLDQEKDTSFDQGISGSPDFDHTTIAPDRDVIDLQKNTEIPEVLVKLTTPQAGEEETTSQVSQAITGEGELLKPGDIYYEHTTPVVDTSDTSNAGDESHKMDEDDYQFKTTLIPEHETEVNELDKSEADISQHHEDDEHQKTTISSDHTDKINAEDQVHVTDEDVTTVSSIKYVTESDDLQKETTETIHEHAVTSSSHVVEVHPGEEDKIDLTTPVSTLTDTTTITKTTGVETDEHITPIEEEINIVTVSPVASSEGDIKYTKLPEHITTISDVNDKYETISPVTEINELENEIHEDHHKHPVVEEPSRVPGEGDCLVDGITYRNNARIPTINKCQTSCQCVNSILKCDHVECSPPPSNMVNCQPIYHGKDTCCPMYTCDHESVTIESDNQISDITTRAPEQSPNIDRTEIPIDNQDKIHENIVPEQVLEKDSEKPINIDSSEQMTTQLPKEQVTEPVDEEPIISPIYVPDCGSDDCKIVKKPEVSPIGTTEKTEKLPEDEQTTEKYEDKTELNIVSEKGTTLRSVTDVSDLQTIEPSFDSESQTSIPISEHDQTTLRDETSKHDEESEDHETITTSSGHGEIEKTTPSQVHDSQDENELTDDLKKDTVTEKINVEVTTITPKDDTITTEKQDQELVTKIIKEVEREPVVTELSPVDVEMTTKYIHDISQVTETGEDKEHENKKPAESSTVSGIDENETTKLGDSIYKEKPVESDLSSTASIADSESTEKTVINEDNIITSTNIPVHSHDDSDYKTSKPTYEYTTISSDDVNKIGVSVLPTDSVDDISPKKPGSHSVGGCGHAECQVEVQFTRHPTDTTTENVVLEDCTSGNCIDQEILPEKTKETECGENGCDVDDQQNIITDEIGKPVCGPNGCKHESHPMIISSADSKDKVEPHKEPTTGSPEVSQTTDESSLEPSSETKPDCVNGVCTFTDDQHQTKDQDAIIFPDSCEGHECDDSKKPYEQTTQKKPTVVKEETQTVPITEDDSQAATEQPAKQLETTTLLTIDESYHEKCIGDECSIKPETETTRKPSIEESSEPQIPIDQILESEVPTSTDVVEKDKHDDTENVEKTTHLPTEIASTEFEKSDDEKITLRPIVIEMHSDKPIHEVSTEISSDSVMHTTEYYVEKHETLYPQSHTIEEGSGEITPIDEISETNEGTTENIKVVEPTTLVKDITEEHQMTTVSNKPETTEIIDNQTVKIPTVESESKIPLEESYTVTPIEEKIHTDVHTLHTTEKDLSKSTEYEDEEHTKQTILSSEEDITKLPLIPSEDSKDQYTTIISDANIKPTELAVTEKSMAKDEIEQSEEGTTVSAEKDAVKTPIEQTAHTEVSSERDDVNKPTEQYDEDISHTTISAKTHEVTAPAEHPDKHITTIGETGDIIKPSEITEEVFTPTTIGTEKEEESHGGISHTTISAERDEVETSNEYSEEDIVHTTVSSDKDTVKTPIEQSVSAEKDDANKPIDQTGEDIIHSETDEVQKPIDQSEKDIIQTTVSTQTNEVETPAGQSEEIIKHTTISLEKDSVKTTTELLDEEIAHTTVSTESETYKTPIEHPEEDIIHTTVTLDRDDTEKPIDQPDKEISDTTDNAEGDDVKSIAHTTISVEQHEVQTPVGQPGEEIAQTTISSEKSEIHIPTERINEDIDYTTTGPERGDVKKPIEQFEKDVDHTTISAEKDGVGVPVEQHKEDIAHTTIGESEDDILHTTISAEKDIFKTPIESQSEEDIVHPTISTEKDEILKTTDKTAEDVVHTTIKAESSKIDQSDKDIAHTTINYEKDEVKTTAEQSEEDIAHTTVSAERDGIKSHTEQPETDIVQTTTTVEKDEVKKPFDESVENAVQTTISTIRDDEGGLEETAHTTISAERDEVKPTEHSEEHIDHTTISAEKDDVQKPIDQEEEDIHHTTISVGGDVTKTPVEQPDQNIAHTTVSAENELNKSTEQIEEDITHTTISSEGDGDKIPIEQLEEDIEHTTFSAEKDINKLTGLPVEHVTIGTATDDIKSPVEQPIEDIMHTTVSSEQDYTKTQIIEEDISQIPIHAEKDEVGPHTEQPEEVLQHTTLSGESDAGKTSTGESIAHTKPVEQPEQDVKHVTDRDDVTKPLDQSEEDVAHTTVSAERDVVKPIDQSEHDIAHTTASAESDVTKPIDHSEQDISHTTDSTEGEDVTKPIDQSEQDIKHITVSADRDDVTKPVGQSEEDVVQTTVSAERDATKPYDHSEQDIAHTTVSSEGEDVTKPVEQFEQDIKHITVSADREDVTKPFDQSEEDIAHTTVSADRDVTKLIDHSEQEIAHTTVSAEKEDVIKLIDHSEQEIAHTTVSAEKEDITKLIDQSEHDIAHTTASAKSDITKPVEQSEIDMAHTTASAESDVTKQVDQSEHDIAHTTANAEGDVTKPIDHSGQDVGPTTISAEGEDITKLVDQSEQDIKHITVSADRDDFTKPLDQSEEDIAHTTVSADRDITKPIDHSEQDIAHTMISTEGEDVTKSIEPSEQDIKHTTVSAERDITKPIDDYEQENAHTTVSADRDVTKPIDHSEQEIAHTTVSVDRDVTKPIDHSEQEISHTTVSADRDDVTKPLDQSEEDVVHTTVSTVKDVTKPVDQLEQDLTHTTISAEGESVTKPVEQSEQDVKLITVSADRDGVTKPLDQSEEDAAHTTVSAEKDVTKPVNQLEEDLTHTTISAEEEGVTKPVEQSEQDIKLITVSADRDGVSKPLDQSEEDIVHTTVTAERDVVKPIDQSEHDIAHTTASAESEVTKPIDHSEQDIGHTTDSIEGEDITKPIDQSEQDIKQDTHEIIHDTSSERDASKPSEEEITTISAEKDKVKIPDEILEEDIAHTTEIAKDDIAKKPIEQTEDEIAHTTISAERHEIKTEDEIAHTTISAERHEIKTPIEQSEEDTDHVTISAQTEQSEQTTISAERHETMKPIEQTVEDIDHTTSAEVHTVKSPIEQSEADISQQTVGVLDEINKPVEQPEKDTAHTTIRAEIDTFKTPYVEEDHTTISAEKDIVQITGSAEKDDVTEPIDQSEEDIAHTTFSTDRDTSRIPVESHHEEDVTHATVNVEGDNLGKPTEHSEEDIVHTTFTAERVTSKSPIEPHHEEDVTHATVNVEGDNLGKPTEHSEEDIVHTTFTAERVTSKSPIEPHHEEDFAQTTIRIATDEVEKPTEQDTLHSTVSIEKEETKKPIDQPGDEVGQTTISVEGEIKTSHQGDSENISSTTAISEHGDIDIPSVTTEEAQLVHSTEKEDEEILHKTQKPDITLIPESLEKETEKPVEDIHITKPSFEVGSETSSEKRPEISENMPDHHEDEQSIDKFPETTPYSEVSSSYNKSTESSSTPTVTIHDYITSKVPIVDETTVSLFHDQHPESPSKYPDTVIEPDHGQSEISSLPNPDEDEDHQVPQLPSYGSHGSEDQDYEEEDQAFGPGTCRYGGKVYVSAQQIPRDDPCDFCFCFRSDIICLQQSCPPPIQHCHEEPIQGFCCPRYECPVSMATVMNVTTTTTTTTTTLPPHFLSHAYKGQAQRRGCQVKGQAYQVGEVIKQTSGPCLHCTCGRDGQMKCDPKVCTPEPMLRQMIAVAATSRRR